MAHGSVDPNWIRPFEDLAGGVEKSLGTSSVRLAFLQVAAPTLADAVAEAANDIKPGVVSMAHAWGDAPEHLLDVRKQGASTNRLVDDNRTYDRITGQPRMTAIPVNVTAEDNSGDQAMPGDC